MRSTAIVGLVLVMFLVSLSAYLRLDHSGIGCTPWPECYGNIGQQQTEVGPQQAYDRLVAEAREPLSWTRPMHRLIASVLGILVLGLLGMSIRYRRQRTLCCCLLFLTVFLAWIGIYSEGLHSPAIVMGNLGGGFAMLGIMGWMSFVDDGEGPNHEHANAIGAWSTLAIIVVFLQILAGGLVSANFAATACNTLPHCNGALLPDKSLWQALDLTRSIDVSNAGFAIGGGERIAIHLLHRLIAVIAAAMVIGVGVKTLRAKHQARKVGALVCLIVVAEVLIGITAVLNDVPIAVAVAHNWMAGLLLLGLIRIRTAC